MEQAITEPAVEVSEKEPSWKLRLRCLRDKVTCLWADYKTMEDTAAAHSLSSMLPLMLALVPGHAYLSYYFATHNGYSTGESFIWAIKLSAFHMNMGVVCFGLILATVAAVSSESFRKVTAFSITTAYLIFTSFLVYTPITLGVLDEGTISLVAALIIFSSIYIAPPKITVPLFLTAIIFPVVYLSSKGVALPSTNLISLWLFLTISLIMSVKNWHSFYERIKAQEGLEKANRVLSLQKDILAKLSEIDELTSLATRRKFWDTMKRDYAKATRLGPKGVSSLLFINIDNLKVINEAYDHDVGDKVLSRVAKRILNCLRSTDVAGRLGNDEFAIFLPETDLPGAKLLAEKIRADIEEHVLVFIDPEKASTARIHATLSIGISCGRGSFLGVKGLTPDQLFSRATTACKKAKQQGGNRFLALEDTELKE